MKGPRVTVRRFSPLTLPIILFLAIAGLLVSAVPAQADLYRYWSVWQENNGQWTFAETGPDSITPSNGAVVGWRFGAGGVDASTTRAPRVTPAFDDVCAGVEVPDGDKAVAVVIDTGTQADSPDGANPPSPVLTCVVAPESANTVQVLQAGADTRIEGGLVCAILGFPASGCGDTIAGATGTPTDTADDLAVEFTQTESLPVTFDGGTPADAAVDTTSSNTGLLVLGGIAALLAAGAVGFAMVRRNRDLDRYEARTTDPHDTSGTTDKTTPPTT